MIDSKTVQEISVMAEGGRKLGRVLNELMEMSQVGVSLEQIELRAQELIKDAGGTPSFMTVEDYKWATCLCVNEVVVHGIPTKYTLKDGDLLTVDVGMLYKGLHTDTAWTKIINSELRTENSMTSKIHDELNRFLMTGKSALEKAIAQAKLGNRIGHISQVIEQKVTDAGYSIVKTLVGHGVGKELHEDPQVPGFLRIPVEKTIELRLGMTIAIEVIYAMGKGEIVYDNDDGWSLATKDRSRSAVFEHTIVITESGPLVLTQGDI